MKEDLPHGQTPDNPDSNQEKWLSREEVLQHFPVLDNQLKYWRQSKKARSKTIRNNTFYLESDIQRMVEWQSRAKKRIRKQYVARKLASIDYVLGITIFAVAWAWVTGVSLEGPWWNFILRNFFLSLVLFISFIYGTVRLIQYLKRRRHARKEKSGK